MRAIAIAAALACLPAIGQLEVKYDRFKHRTELWAPAISKTSFPKGRFEVQAFTNFAGEKPDAPPPRVAIAFRTSSPNGWEYLKCHGVDALVDGKPFPMPPPRHDGSTIYGSLVHESIRIEPTWAEFSRIAAAKTVEFRVCTTEIKVPEKRLADWRALVAAGTPK